jgi:peptidoglycan/xylan/chitin deacetylase (PgdA/CDA1 family)
LGDFIKARTEGRALPNRSLVLTFDDGFRNFLTVAAPLLRSRGVAATLFLITDKAGENGVNHPPPTWTPEDDHRYLSWSEVRRLIRGGGIEVGSHTCSHPGLLTLSPAESRRELQHSYDDLTRSLGVKTAALSYPKGQYSSVIAEQARQVGYACAVTTDRGVNEPDHDLFTLGRTLIGDFDDDASFAVRVSGLRWVLVKTLSVFLPRRPVAPSLKQATTEKYPGEIYEI